MPQRMDTVRHDHPDRAVLDLLVEAYRERSALLGGTLAAPAALEHPPSPVVDIQSRRQPHRPQVDATPRIDAAAVRNAAAAHSARVVPRIAAPVRPQPIEVATAPPEARIPSAHVSERARTAAPAPATAPRLLDAAARLQPLARMARKLPTLAARGWAAVFVTTRAPETDNDLALIRLWQRGLVLIGVFGGAFVLWALAAPMSSAVVAPGQFVVDNSVKKVQHPTGGVVGQILVREGDRVAEGDLLIRLDETVTRANLQVIVGQLDELFGRKARLEAERDGRDRLEPPAELTGRMRDPEVARIIAAEQRLFQARRAARESQRAQLERRIAQLRSEITGLQSQQAANLREAQIIAEELVGVRDLFKKQLTPIMRLNGLERQAVSLDGQKGQLAASVAQSEGKISEIELQIMHIDEDLRAEAQKELREVQGKVAELSERRVAAEDQLKRVEMRAPISGVVHQLGTHTVGGVITPAEAAMLIVPTKEELVLEAKVAPQDRDPLAVGQSASVRVNATGQRSTPQLAGSVTRISADVSRDTTTTAAPFYTVRIAIPASELARLRTVNISAGMQAEVFIEVGARSPLQYLLRPLTDQATRAFRER